MGRYQTRGRMLTLCLCMALAIALPWACVAERSGDFDYIRLEGGGAEITGWSGADTVIEIPAELGGEPVISIGANAFAGCELAEQVILPEGVEALGDGAFADCYSLESVSIPASVARVGENPFAGCESIRKLDLADGQAYLAMVNGVLFGDNGRRLIFCPRTLPMERYVAPEGTERIDERAFSYCNRLLSVTLPDTVTEIGADAFERRANLTLVVGRGSYGEQYAKDNDIKYTYPDADEWLAIDGSEEMGS